MGIFKCHASQPQPEYIVMEGWSCNCLWVLFFYIPLQKCFWIRVGLGVHPLLARQFASSRNQTRRTPSWSNAKPATLSSALLANLIGIQVKAVRRTCQSLFFQGKQGRVFQNIRHLETKHWIFEQIWIWIVKKHFPDTLFLSSFLHLIILLPLMLYSKNG